jgi:transcriptional regulator with XRE-family HTH domain
MLIRQTRKEACITQQELAECIGITKSYVLRLENGRIEPSAGMFLRIIAALGLKFDIVEPVS